jgi:DNA-binding transcriptional ArsR family regulator
LRSEIANFLNPQNVSGHCNDLPQNFSRQKKFDYLKFYFIFASKIFSQKDNMTKKISLETIGRLGKQISDTTILMHEAIAKKAGLTGTDHKYLSLLIDKGKLTAGELSTLTGLSTGAATGLIDRFEKKKLVKREFDKTDRRKVYIIPNI